MMLLNRTIEQAFGTLFPSRHTVLPGEPSNDNISASALADHLSDLRSHAGADYVPARAKAWWLP